VGELVDFPSNGDRGTGYLARPESGAGPGVIVLQEWWGMVPHIQNVADRFAAAGFTALVPDLYRGHISTEPDEAMKLMMGMNLERAGTDMSGAVDYLVELVGGPVGVVGFCMGGGLALVLACQRPDVVAAVVPFYGLIPWPQAQPDYNHLAGAMQGHYAERDGFASPASAHALAERLQGLGKTAGVFVYEDTDHAFFNDERPEVYSVAASTLAWSRTVDFLTDQLARPFTPGVRASVALRAARPMSTAEPVSTDVDAPPPHDPFLPPVYRGGHFDTTADAFPWLLDFGIFKTGWIPIGDADDGPVISLVSLGAGIPEDGSHFHNSAQVRYFISGSLRIGNRWYKCGDIRIQQPGVPYGPEEVGPEGCLQLLYFTDRRGLFPHYQPAHVEAHQAQLDGFAALMTRTGITPN
jgi:carboxymethylenebutenolidase